MSLQTQMANAAFCNVQSWQALAKASVNDELLKGLLIFSSDSQASLTRSAGDGNQRWSAMGTSR